MLNAGKKGRKDRQLKEHLRAKLHRTRIADGRDRAKISRRHVGAQSPKVHIIENIKCLSTELEAEAFAKTEILYHCNIKSNRPRASDVTPSRVSNGVWNEDPVPRGIGKWRICLKARSIEKILKRPGSANIRITQHIRPTGRICIQNSQAGRIVCSSDRGKRNARIVSRNTVKLPTAQKLSYNITLFLEKRQLVNVIDIQIFVIATNDNDPAH